MCGGERVCSGASLLLSSGGGLTSSRCVPPPQRACWLLACVLCARGCNKLVTATLPSVWALCRAARSACRQRERGGRARGSVMNCLAVGRTFRTRHPCQATARAHSTPPPSRIAHRCQMRPAGPRRSRWRAAVPQAGHTVTLPTKTDSDSHGAFTHGLCVRRAARRKAHTHSKLTSTLLLQSTAHGACAGQRPTQAAGDTHLALTQSAHAPSTESCARRTPQSTALPCNKARCTCRSARFLHGGKALGELRPHENSKRPARRHPQRAHRTALHRRGKAQHWPRPGDKHDRGDPMATRHSGPPLWSSTRH